MAFNGSIEDRLAIRELIETYADAVMRYDADAWAATWDDDDPRWCLTGHPELAEVRGKSEIIDAWKSRMARHVWVSFIASPGGIAVNGDVAEVRSYTTEAYSSGEVRRDVLGRYDDVIVRKPEGWRFKIRNFTTIARA